LYCIRILVAIVCCVMQQTVCSKQTTSLLLTTLATIIEEYVPQINQIVVRQNTHMGEPAEDIQILRETIHSATRRNIEHSIDEVRGNVDIHRYTRYKLCNGCDRNKPLETRKCGNCSSREFRDEVCKNSTRLLWFMDWLESRQYWPLSYHSERSCWSVAESGEEQASHYEASSCGSNHLCPLVAVKTSLVENVRATLHQSAGLGIEAYCVASTHVN
jgi:hypothetical protein